MLALTPAPLHTAGERALFGELTRWDTGASVRAAVVASIPLIDGLLGRRISDAVLFMPEGLAVIRIAEVLRQSGVVKAVPEGAWAIAPESGPGQALQLSGGGSTPLDGLMRAGMDVAMKLRRAGLEPGRIARLTVLVGDVTGLIPGDGDLGEGDLVARLEPRSLLLGIARCSRYAGVDNPRLWTTADVRAAFEALELSGRGPSVEELNGEGFPYSPYVLRRPELMTPAATAAIRAPAGSPAGFSAGSTAGSTAPGAGPAQAPVREQPSQAAVAEASRPERGTVAVGGPPAPPDGDGGIGGLFAGAEPERPRGTVVPPRRQAPPRTSVFPRATSDDPPARPRGRAALLAAVALLVVAVLAAGGWLFLRDEGRAGGRPAAGSSSPSTAAVELSVGATQVVGGTPFTVQALQADDTCAGHAYGDTAAFLAATDCTGLSRALYSAQVDGAPVVVSVVRVRMSDTGVARELQTLTDRDGSGNVSDLLREGVRYPGSPAELSGAEYASAVSGPTVTIVKNNWVDEDAAGASPAIDAIADAGLSLPVPPFPGG